MCPSAIALASAATSRTSTSTSRTRSSRCASTACPRTKPCFSRPGVRSSHVRAQRRVGRRTLEQRRPARAGSLYHHRGLRARQLRSGLRDQRGARARPGRKEPARRELRAGVGLSGAGPQRVREDPAEILKQSGTAGYSVSTDSLAKRLPNEGASRVQLENTQPCDFATSVMNSTQPACCSFVRHTPSGRVVPLMRK